MWSQFRNIASQTNFTLGGTASGAVLVAVTVNTAATSAVITIRNGSSSGALVATIDASVAAGTRYYGVRCPDGIYVVQTGGSADATISYL